MSSEKWIWIAIFVFCMLVMAMGYWQFAVAGLIAFAYMAWRLRNRG